MLRFLTGGESHGPALVVVVEGLPAGMPITIETFDRELARRRLGFGRGRVSASSGTTSRSWVGSGTASRSARPCRW